MERVKPVREAYMRPSLLTTLRFGWPLLVLAFGHMLSNAVRTLPAIASDVVGADIGVSLESLASLTGAYHFAFAAGQIPVGVALDRYGVRRVSLFLFAIVIIGAVVAALCSSAAGFLVAQISLGLGCCGMLLCPMTLAAKLLTPYQFGLWSGLIQGVGNTGMLLSASPMAWLIEHQGWRACFWGIAVLAVIVALLVAISVPDTAQDPVAPKAGLGREARDVLAIGLSRPLWGVVILAFVSFAAAIAVRGLWGGPWLMDVKHLDRVGAGNAMLPMTIALVSAPIVYGLLDRRFGNRRAFLGLGHACAGAVLLLVAAGGPGGPLSQALGVGTMPATFDIWAFMLFGAGVAVQPLLFAMARSSVSPAVAGKALAAVNLSFFGGAALLQAATSPIAAVFGLPSVMGFLGFVVLVASALFISLTK